MIRNIYLSNTIYNSFERNSFKDCRFEDYKFTTAFERESFVVLNLLRVVSVYNNACKNLNNDIHKPDFFNDIVVSHLTNICKALSMCCNIFNIKSNIIFENNSKNHKTDVLFLINMILFRNETNRDKREIIIMNILKGVISTLVPDVGDRLDLIRLYIEDKKLKVLEEDFALLSDERDRYF